MRKLGTLVVAAALTLGLAGSASAGTFSSGVIGLAIGALPPITLPSSGGSFTVTAGGAYSEPASIFGPTSIQLPRGLFTGVASISGLTLANFGNGPVTGTLPTGNGGLQGDSLVNVLGLLNLTIPLAPVGAGGTTYVVAGGITITVQGQQWTTGAGTVMGITTASTGGANVNTFTISGGVSGTLSGNATVTLVTVFKAITNVAGNLPGFAIQTLTFVPEPGFLILLGSGAAGMLIGGWLRMRR